MLADEVGITTITKQDLEDAITNTHLTHNINNSFHGFTLLHIACCLCSCTVVETLLTNNIIIGTPEVHDDNNLSLKLSKEYTSHS